VLGPFQLLVNTAPLFMLLLVWYSVWDAAMYSFPPTINDALAQRLRALRLVMLSGCIASIFMLAIYAVLSIVFNR
jgi:hypothetical protein